MTEDPRETELKLDLAPDDVAALLACPVLAEAEGHRETALVTTYYDTPRRDLREAGLTLRVRAAEGRHRQTVKRGASGGGLFDRGEWEEEVAGPTPDPAAWARTPAGAILSEDVVPVPLFTVRVTRTTRTLRRGDAAMEIAVDHGAVETVEGARAAPFAEAEIELRSGVPADLYALARDLVQAVPLRLGVTTKAERGFVHLDGAPRIRKAEAVVLDPSMDAAAAFQAVARACLRHLRLNEPLLLAERDPDALHQARVAVRRLRSAISLFKPVVAHPETTRLRETLRERVAVLGTARNLDVLLLQTLPAEMERRPEAARSFLALRARLEAERAQAYDAVLAMIASPDWRLLILDLAALIDGGAWLTSAQTRTARDEPVADFAARLLETRRRRVKRRGRHLARLTPEARHAVRIEAKKLRYGAEFFASLAHGGKGRRRQAAFTAALSELQDALGALNDVETAREMLAGAAARAERLGEEGAAFAAGLFTADREHGGKGAHAAAQAYARFAEVKRFWDKP